VSTDADALTIFPHMHLIGRSIKVVAHPPEGEPRTLLEINDWDFNWQDLYQFAEPVRLAAGTKITLDAVHDNSAENPQNPRHPPERVRWGEQSFDEMSLAFINLVPVAASGPAGGDERQKTIATLRQADKDGDRRLSVAEIVAALGNKRTVEQIEKIVAQFDRDGDKHLNLEESLAAVAAQKK
jgi:hypothetical protein